MIKLEEIIVFGKSKQIDDKLSVESVLSFFGEPEIFTPAYKSYPLMIVYGDLEFRFRNQNLETITITFEENGTQLPSQIDHKQFDFALRRELNAIEDLLKQYHVTWKKDEIMSDSEQVVYITEHNVHLAFYKGLLTKIGIVY